MTNREREKLIKELLDKCLKLRQTKGIEYSNSDDINANFKAGEKLGLTPEQTCMVYALKHYQSIEYYVKNQKYLSEPIEGRIQDLVNYLLILYSLLRDKP